MDTTNKCILVVSYPNSFGKGVQNIVNYVYLLVMPHYTYIFMLPTLLGVLNNIIV